MTEMVTGLRFGHGQIRVAAGMELNFTRRTCILRGHAIECRINAETRRRGSVPSWGKMTLLHQCARRAGCALIPRSIRTTSFRRFMIR